MRNRYLKHAHISERKFKQILTCFCRDFTAEGTSLITGISRNTINGLFGKFRARILEQTSGSMNLDGEVEVDESYFGARRVRGKRGRGARGKVPVWDYLKDMARYIPKSSPTVPRIS